MDETVRLWDVTTTGAGLNMDSYRGDTITSVAFSSDGRRVISGDGSGTVRLCDAVTGKPGLVLQSGYKNANCVAFSSDDLRVATAGRDGFGRTWSSESGALNFILKGHTDIIEAMTFSPDGQWIVSGSWDGTVRLWCACSGTLARVLSGHSDTVQYVTFLPCGLKVVSCSRDGATRVWDIGTGESRVIANVSCDLHDIAVSPTTRQVALVRVTSTGVELWDEESEEPLTFLEHGCEVIFVSLSPCGQWIASGFDDVMWLWHLVWKGTEHQWEHVLGIGDILSGVSCVAWRPGELEFVAGSSSGFVQVWGLVEESDGKFSARMMWTLGRTAFTVTDAVITGAVGLNEPNQILLKQRGAKDGSESIDDTLDDSKDDYSDGSQNENQEESDTE